MQMILPEGWTHPKRYNHGIVAEGRLLFVAGQVATNAHDVIVHEAFVDQVGQALSNVAAVLGAAGASPEHLTRLVWYVTDIEGYRSNAKAIGQLYRAIIGAHLPTMAMVEVTGLVRPEAKVEIEAMAVLPR
jgi:enamine deaminase RidA (YjgF/YER057c/UK114 family)